MLNVAARHVDEWVGHVLRECSRQEVAEVWGSLTGDKGGRSVVGVEPNTMSGTIGRCAGEEVVDALVIGNSV